MQETSSVFIPSNVVDNYLNGLFLFIFHWHYCFYVDTHSENFIKIAKFFVVRELCVLALLCYSLNRQTFY